MVAAPESVQAQAETQQQQQQQQQQQKQPQLPVKFASKDASAAASTSPANESAPNGVDGLTVVDTQTTSAPASTSVHKVSSHHSNFDPTPAPQANLPPRDVAKLIPCRFFPQGTCKYGDSCIFSHGYPGVAGSPGVPPSPSVQAQLPPAQGHQHQHQHQQQGQHHFAPYHQDEYMQGMSMYYPEQPLDQYGYSQAPFSGQSGYYPFPPPFYGQPYQQGPPPPPQAFYPAPPQQQPSPGQQMLSPLVGATEAQAASPVAAEVSPSSTSPDVQQPAVSPAGAAFTSPAAVPGVVLPFSAPAAPYAPFPGQQAAEFAYSGGNGAAAPTSPSFGPTAKSRAAPSLHTFFQTGALAAASPPAPNAASAAAAAPSGPTSGAFPNGKPAPHINSNGNGMNNGSNGVRPRNLIPGPAGPFGNGIGPNGKPQRRYPAGSPRPPCSFFEGNRCRNRDACPFQHLLPDGTDARLLGQGWVGADGRTDNPEEKGGLPATWLANPNWKKNGGNNAFYRNGVVVQGQGAAFTNGFRQQRNRFEEEQARLRADTQAQQAAAAANSGNVSDASSGVTAVLAANGSRLLPGGAAPQLVAAIHGLTRRIPPVHNRDGNATQHNASTSAQPSDKATSASTSTAEPVKASAAPVRASQQRVPSGDDFPALSSAPLSPSLESTNAAAKSASPSRDASPSPAVPTAIVAPVEKEKMPEVTSKEATSTAADHDFVMVNHADAPVSETSAATAETAPAETAPAAEKAPAAAPPRIVGSFASAAARGASVVLPEKPKKVIITPASVPAAGSNAETPGSTKEKKDGPSKKGGKGANKRSSAAPSNVSPVAVKA